MDFKKLIYALPVVFLLTLGFFSFKMRLELDNLNEISSIRYKSYIVADELRQSSADLSRLARTYVSTQDAKYEKEYWDILAWRGGKVKRPNSFYLYPGKAIAQSEIMKELGFTREEFEKVELAAKKSDDLVRTETIAMNAVKGLQEDGKTPYSGEEPPLKLAQRVMFDNTYHANVENIMAPILEFFDMLDKRTKGAVERVQSEVSNISTLIIVCLVLLSVSIVAAVYTSRNALAKVISEVAVELRKSADNNSKNSQTLSSRATELAASTNEQSAASQETMAAMTEISGMLRSTSEKTTESNDLIIEVNGKIRQGIKIVDDLSSSMSSILVATKNLGEFESIIAEIEDKTAVINDIVFKTQLLSFNASIEAARAGAHGQGFAVVAEEVGNLADLSGKAALEITGLLGKSTSQVKNLVEGNMHSVEKGQASSEQVNTFFADIAKALEQMTENINSIVSATGEQETGVAEVGAAIRQLEVSARENASVVQDVSLIAANSENIGRGLISLTKKLEDLIYGSKTSKVKSMSPLRDVKSDHDDSDQDVDYSSFSSAA